MSHVQDVTIAREGLIGGKTDERCSEKVTSDFSSGELKSKNTPFKQAYWLVSPTTKPLQDAVDLFAPDS